MPDSLIAVLSDSADEASDASDSESSYADENAQDDESVSDFEPMLNSEYLRRKRSRQAAAGAQETAADAAADDPAAKRPRRPKDAVDPAPFVAELKCSITNRLFVDPVTLSVDQHVYEHAAIRRWIEDKGKSPLTRAPVDKDDPSALIRNRLVRKLVRMAVERGWADKTEIEEYTHDVDTHAKRRGFYSAQLGKVEAQLAELATFDGDPQFRWQDRSMRVALLLAKQEAKQHLDTYYPDTS